MPSESEARPVSTNFYVGFFDILGYRSFLANNADQEGSEETIRAVLKTLSTAKDVSLSWTEEVDARDIREALAEKMDVIAISDTIVVLVPEHIPPISDEVAGAAFIKICASIAYSLFSEGLPVRGDCHLDPQSQRRTVLPGAQFWRLIHYLRESMLLASSSQTLFTKKCNPQPNLRVGSSGIDVL